MAAADNVRQIETIPEFTSEAAKDRTPRPKIRFKFDGHLYTLRQPKMVITMHLLRIKDGEQSLEAGWDTIQLLSSMIGYIETESPDENGQPRGQAHLLHRLGDTNDSLDLIDLAKPFMELIDQVFERPTGSPAASSKRPARTSKGGAAGTRTRRAVTSTT